MDFSKINIKLILGLLSLIVILVFGCKKRDKESPRLRVFKKSQPHFKDFVRIQKELASTIDLTMTEEDNLILNDLREKYQGRIIASVDRMNESLAKPELKKMFTQQLVRMEHQIDCGDFYQLWFKTDTLSLQNVAFLCEKYSDKLRGVFIERKKEYRKLKNIEKEYFDAFKENRRPNIKSAISKEIADSISIHDYNCAILFTINPKLSIIAP